MRAITSVNHQWLYDGMCRSIQGKVGNTYEAGKLNLTRYLTYPIIFMMLPDVICILLVV